MGDGEANTIAMQSPSAAKLEVVSRPDDELPHIELCGLNVLDLRVTNEREDLETTEKLQHIGRRYDEHMPVQRDVLFKGNDLSLFRDAVIKDDAFIVGTFQSKHIPFLVSQRERIDRLSNNKNTPRFSGRWAFIQKSGSANYYHWTMECFPRLTVLAPMVERGEVDGIILYYNKVPSFVAQSIAIDFPQLVDRIHIVSSALIFVEELLFFVVDTDPALRGRTRITTSTVEMIQRIAQRPTPDDQIVFVPRGAMASRRLLNEDELLDDLRQHYDVDVVVGHDLTVEEQRRRFSTAKAIVGTHGAGLSNVIYAPQGCKLIEITSSQYFVRTHCFHHPARLSCIDPYLVVCDQVGDRTEIVDNVGNDLVIQPDSFGAIRELIG